MLMKALLDECRQPKKRAHADITRNGFELSPADNLCSVSVNRRTPVDAPHLLSVGDSDAAPRHETPVSRQIAWLFLSNVQPQYSSDNTRTAPLTSAHPVRDFHILRNTFAVTEHLRFQAIKALLSISAVYVAIGTPPAFHGARRFRHCEEFRHWKDK